MHLLLLLLNGLGFSAAVDVARLVNRQDAPSETAAAAENTDPSASPRITCTINNDPGSGDLPRTSFSKGALPVTLSQAQAADLAAFEGTTTEKAAVVATEGEDKSTFTTEVIVGPGGFFWVAEPMDGFIWHALPPQEPPPLPTTDCYTFGDVYETGCPREGEGAGGGAEGESGNGNGGEPPADLTIGNPQPGQPGEPIPTETPDTTGQAPEPPTEEGEPEGSTSGNTGEEGTPPEAETPEYDGSDGTTPPVGSNPDEPNTGDQAGGPEQPGNETPSSDQQDPEKTTPGQPPSDGGAPDAPDNRQGSPDQEQPPSEKTSSEGQYPPDQPPSDEQDQEGSAGQPSEAPSTDEQPSSDEETLVGDQDPQETTPGEPADSNTPDPSPPTDTEPEESGTPSDENGDNGEDEESTPDEEGENNGEGEEEQEQEEDNSQEGGEDNAPDDGDQGDGGDDSEVGGGRNGGDDDDDGAAVPIPIPGPGDPPLPGPPAGTVPGNGPPPAGPPAGGGGGQAPGPGSNPPAPSPPENQPEEPEPTATEEPATSTEEPESSTSSSCGSSPTLLPEGLVRRQDLPVQDWCEPPDDRWVVWCLTPNDQASTSAIEAKMRDVLGPDANIYKAKWENRIGFFRAQMNLEQVRELETLPDVEHVRLSRTGHSLLEEGTGETPYKLVRQPVAEASLQSVSQPPGRRIPYFQGNYVYDESAAEGIEVYIVDTGAKKDHIEFTEGYNIMEKARYLTIPDFDGELREDDSQQPEIPVGTPDIGHGTCMLSRIGGHIFGVAKKITPIIARVPRERWSGGAVAHEEYLDALKRVDQDMGDGKKAIVNISWLIQRREFGKWAFPKQGDESVDNSEWFEEAIHKVLVSIIKKGGYVFVGSGNAATREVDGWPARLAKPSLGDRYIPELTVVGAAGVNGDIWPKTNTDPEGLPHIYAPGYRNSRNPRDDMRCAMIAEEIEGDYRDTGATSAATAMVSGLAAYFLKLSENPDMNIDVSTPELMREFLLEKAWGRTNDDLKAIWNGLTENELPPKSDNNEVLDYCPIPRRLGDEPEPKPSYLKFPPQSNFPVPDNRRKRQEEGIEEEEENLTDDIGMCDPDEGGEEEDDEGENDDSEDEDNGDSGDNEEESDEEPELPELCENLSCPLTGSTDECKCMDKRTVPIIFTA